MNGLLFLLCLFIPQSNTQVQNDLAQLQLKGNVMSISQSECKFKRSGDLDSEWCARSGQRFDVNGNMLEDNEFIPGNKHMGNGALKHKSIYTYDHLGNRITAAFYNDNAGKSRNETYKYDAHNNITERRLSEDIVTVSSYTYNPQGYVTEKKSYNPDNSLLQRTTYAYDEQGNKVLCERYNPDNALQGRYTWQYDKKKRLTEEKYYVTRLITHGRSGNKDHDDETYTTEIIPGGHKSWTYNDSGNIATEVNYNDAGEPGLTTVYRYENYDSNGNWLTKTTTENNEPVTVTERVIVYY